MGSSKLAKSRAYLFQDLTLRGGGYVDETDIRDVLVFVMSNNLSRQTSQVRVFGIGIPPMPHGVSEIVCASRYVADGTNGLLDRRVHCKYIVPAAHSVRQCCRCGGGHFYENALGTLPLE